MHNYLCSNCGEKINDSYNICPVCNAINYKNPEIIKMYQKEKYNPSAVEGYKILFIVLIVIIVVGNIVIGALIFPF